MSRLIVSFTSYPERIDAVKSVLDSLYAQTLKADEIILWLAEEQFPQREAALPHLLQADLMAKRFTLRWCDNLGSHKKYFYAMQEYPEDIIVTVDDDIYYHPDSLEKLMEAHARYPHAVAALTTSLVQLDERFYPLPIQQWLFDFQQISEPSMLLMAGNGGGTLFPPHAIDRRIFEKQLIYDLCAGYGRLFGDDLLLKAGEMLQHTPVLSVKSQTYYRLPDTQETALARILPGEAHKNRAIRIIEERFHDAFTEHDRLRLREALDAFRQSNQYEANIKKYFLERPFRDLDRQLGYLTLPHTPSQPEASDYAKIQDSARIAARIFAAYPSEKPDDEGAKAIAALRKRLLDLPNIEALAKTDVVIRGLIDYGVLLNPKCHVLYRGIPIYMQSLKTWNALMCNHPQCDSIFHEGYKLFLHDAKSAIRKAKPLLSKAQLDEWKKEYKKAIQDYPERQNLNKQMKGIKERMKHLFKS